MARVLIVLGVAAVVFWVFSIVDCAVQPPARHRGVSKGAWIAIVVLIPVLGGILWFVIGRASPQAPGRTIAPDDDPSFLGTLGAYSDQDERIRLLEEELARLDSEDEQPKPDAPEDGPDTDDDARGRSGTA